MKVLLRSRSLAAGGLLALALAALIPATAAAKPEPGYAPARLPAVRPLTGRHSPSTGSTSDLARPRATSASTRRTHRRSAAVSGPRAPATSSSSTPACRSPARSTTPAAPGMATCRAPSSSTRRATTSTATNVEDIYNFQNPADAGAWPEAARVPVEINEADNFYNPVLRGINSASQGDVWFVTWDGNPTLTERPSTPAGRRRRVPRPRLELPDRQRRHRLLHVHVLQRHGERPGRVLRGAVRRSGRSCSSSARSSSVEQQREVPASHCRLAATPSTPCSPAFARRHGRVHGRLELLLGEHAVRHSASATNTRSRSTRRAASSTTTRRSGARRSSVARASWA